MPELALTVEHGARHARLPPRASFGKWARAALRKNACVTLRIVSAPEARRLNRRYRGRDYATNVLSFVYAERRPLIGDIAICAPVVAREARERGISCDAHYAHLVIHAMLHLQGYDHENERDARRMERRESRLLGQLGFADPYGETTRAVSERFNKRPARASRLPPAAARLTQHGRQST